MEKFDLENFPVSESAKNMIASVSDGFYDNSYVGKWLYEVMGQEYDTAREIAEDILNQLFPETATWGLMYHEIKWGLPVRENLPYEERRQLIYRKRDYRAPMTPYRMEGYLKTATGFDVRIADINDPGDYGFVAPHPNVFKAYFMGEGTLASKRARAMLNELKQSHTMFIMNDRTEIVSDKTEWAVYKDCFLQVARYQADNSRAIEIWNNEDGPIARITVCIAGSGLTEDETVIDTNNCPWAMEFIKQHGFGQATGRMVKSGYCTYPVVKLDIEKIGEYLEVA